MLPTQKDQMVRQLNQVVDVEVRMLYTEMTKLFQSSIQTKAAAPEAGELTDIATSLTEFSKKSQQTHKRCRKKILKLNIPKEYKQLFLKQLQQRITEMEAIVKQLRSTMVEMADIAGSLEGKLTKHGLTMEDLLAAEAMEDMSDDGMEAEEDEACEVTVSP